MLDFLMGRLLRTAGFLFLVSHLASADLPVHCTISQITGQWDFHYTLSQTANGPQTCQSDVPNTNLNNIHESSSLKSSIDRASPLTRTLDLTMQLIDASSAPSSLSNLFPDRKDWKYPSVRSQDGIAGRWTTSYDEGFEIRVSDLTLYAFSKYTPTTVGCSQQPKNGDNENNNGDTTCYISSCGETMLGWVHTNEDDPKDWKWGCFYGEKTSSSTGVFSDMSFVRKDSNRKSRKKIVYDKNMVDLYNKASAWKAKHYPEFEALSDAELGARIKNIGLEKFGLTEAVSKRPEPSSFLQVMGNPLSQPSSNLMLVSKGGQESSNNKRFENGDFISGDPASASFECAASSAIHENIDGLPEEFSSLTSLGTDLDIDPVNQGSCGSCYAVASTYAMAMRFKIKLQKELMKIRDAEPFFQGGRHLITSDDFKKIVHNALLNYPINLSTQSVLSCSFYNQGCDGGYPFLVGKWAKEVGVLDDNCEPYRATNDISCKLPAITTDSSKDSLASVREQQFSDMLQTNAKCKDLWYASDYGYVGGFYEHCSEDRLAQEILNNGPVVIAVDAPNALYYYSSDVLTTTSADRTRHCAAAESTLDFNGWEYTNHAIVVVGWGRTNNPVKDCPVKTDSSGKRYSEYWIARNSWGPDWGQKGYVWWCKGKNLNGIESQGVFIDVDITRGLGKEVFDRASNDIRKYHKLLVHGNKHVPLASKSISKQRRNGALLRPRTSS